MHPRSHGPGAPSDRERTTAPTERDGGFVGTDSGVGPRIVVATDTPVGDENEREGTRAAGRVVGHRGRRGT